MNTASLHHVDSNWGCNGLLSLVIVSQINVQAWLHDCNSEQSSKDVWYLLCICAVNFLSY